MGKTMSCVVPNNCLPFALDEGLILNYEPNDPPLYRGMFMPFSVLQSQQITILGDSCHAISLTRIIYERFYCNCQYVDATSLAVPKGFLRRQQ
jgi:hypothetical protein